VNVTVPEVMPYARHVWHVYAVRSRDRGPLQDALQARGVQTNIHYPFPVHLLPAYSDLGYAAGDFPESEAAAQEELSLPMYPEMTREQIETVHSAIQEHCLVHQD